MSNESQRSSAHTPRPGLARVFARKAARLEAISKGEVPERQERRHNTVGVVQPSGKVRYKIRPTVVVLTILFLSSAIHAKVVGFSNAEERRNERARGVPPDKPLPPPERGPKGQGVVSRQKYEEWKIQHSFYQAPAEAVDTKALEADIPTDGRARQLGLTWTYTRIQNKASCNMRYWFSCLGSTCNQYEPTFSPPPPILENPQPEFYVYYLEMAPGETLWLRYPGELPVGHTIRIWQLGQCSGQSTYYQWSASDKRMDYVGALSVPGEVTYRAASSTLALLERQVPNTSSTWQIRFYATVTDEAHADGSKWPCDHLDNTWEGFPHYFDTAQFCGGAHWRRKLPVVLCTALFVVEATEALEAITIITEAAIEVAPEVGVDILEDEAGNEIGYELSLNGPSAEFSLVGDAGEDIVADIDVDISGPVDDGAQGWTADLRVPDGNPSFNPTSLQTVNTPGLPALFANTEDGGVVGSLSGRTASEGMSLVVRAGAPNAYTPAVWGAAAAR